MFFGILQKKLICNHFNVIFCLRGDIMKTLGQRIRDRRIELGMTQEELSKKLGYKNKSTIGKIEADVNDITSSKVVEFAHALDTTAAYLMGWVDEEDNRKRIMALAEDTVLFKELSDLWGKMDDVQKRTFLSLGHALLNTNSPHKD